MHRLITSQPAFDELCEHLRAVDEVAFDTEFISENTYQPELCLLQFATAERCVAVDPYQVPDLSAWWQLMASGNVTVVVHGGREEARFCWRYAEKRPGRLVDVQIAEGLRGRSYPLSYTALVARVLGRTTEGKETRTDWSRRPLSDRQIAYALEDVHYLLAVWDKQRKWLKQHSRLEWAFAEFERALDDVHHERTRENWRRLPGIQGLSRCELAIARDLFEWRERVGQEKDRPVRKVLRDDLIIELAHRKPIDVEDLVATRDMNRGDYRRMAPEMLACIAQAKASAPETWPVIKKFEKDQDEQIIAQLLGLALANRCAQVEVSMGLVGTTNDLKHLVRWHVYGDQSGDPPKLMQGWRGEVCGELLRNMLGGRIALRVSDPKSDHPLTFEEWPGKSAK